MSSIRRTTPVGLSIRKFLLYISWAFVALAVSIFVLLFCRNVVGLSFFLSNFVADLVGLLLIIYVSWTRIFSTLIANAMSRFVVILCLRIASIFVFSILMGVSVQGYSVIEAIGLQSLITESYFAVIVKIMLTPLSLIVSFLINFWTLEKYKESSRRVG